MQASSAIAHGGTLFPSTQPPKPSLSGAGSRPAVCGNAHTRTQRTRARCAPATTASEVPSVQPERSKGAATQQQQVQQEDDQLDFNVPEWVHARNRAFMDKFRGQLILAPLTKGGNRAFRQLTTELGAPVTMSEMAFARMLVKGDRVEQARMKPAVGVEKCFGAQIATKTIDEGTKAVKLAQDSGAAWVDLNVGCPIIEASRRGMGAIMLRKPQSLAKLVAGIAKESELPLTVKIRTGVDKINIQRVVRLLSRTGAAAVTVHGRTMEQRYRKPADWSLIKEAVDANAGFPIIGNGDILTHYDATRRLQESGCHAAMTGRGALIRPWIFQEFKEGRELPLSARDRVGIYRRLVALMKDQFGHDEWGRRKAWYFFPWHFSFFHRYRPLPESLYGETARAYPLINTRKSVAMLGESVDDLSPLERLLRCGNETAHGEMAAVLWDSASDADAITALEKMAESNIEFWEEEERGRAGVDKYSTEAETGSEEEIKGKGEVEG